MMGSGPRGDLQSGWRLWLGAAALAALIAILPLAGQPRSVNPMAGMERATSATEGSRALSERGRDNLLAYSNLIGLVRYFHPSDQAARLDWNHFVIDTVGEVEEARDGEMLLDVFARLMGSVAPTARFFRSGQVPPVVAPPKASGARVIAWRHYGLQTSAERSGFHFASRRIGGFEVQPLGEVFSYVDVPPPPGAKIRLRVAARSSTDGKGIAHPPAEVWLRALADQDQALGESHKRIDGTDWGLYSVELIVPAGTKSVQYGLRLLAADAAWIDESSIERLDEAGVTELARFGFDQDVADGLPAGWSQEPPSLVAGFKAGVHAKRPYRGTGSLRLRRASPEPLPDPARPVVADLGAGVSVVLPVALYADHTGTLPPGSGLLPDSREGRAFESTGDDRSTRLADVLLLRAALTRFYPDPKGRRAIAEAAGRALQSAATDPDARRFHDTLRRFVHVLNDGHADVMHASDWRRSRLPLLWRWVEEQLVVTSVDPGAPLKEGDIVLAVDGRPVEEALRDAQGLVSGATAEFRRYRALEYLASGDQGQERRLLVRRAKEEPFEIGLRCSVPAFGPLSPHRRSPAKVAELESGIFYLDLDRINNQDFTNALPQLERAQGIIFDLRGYPGSVSPRLFLARLLRFPVTATSVMSIVTRPDVAERLDTRLLFLLPETPRLKARIVFLADERAVSVAENLLEIVVENHLATLVGAPTAGTQGEIDEMILPGNYFVLWTGTRDGKGPVQPSVRVDPSLAGLAAGRDEVLEAAVIQLQHHAR